MTGLMDRVAGAPISWGVCEVPGWGHQLEPEQVLGEMARIGLSATELGPPGFLPRDPDRLRAVLRPHRLRLVAGFVPAILHLPERTDEELARVERSADLLAAAGADVLVLAASTGQAGYEARAELDRGAWASLVEGIDRAIDAAAERDLTPALHPHRGTVIERPHHVERLLETSSVALCLDTGHLMVGGADPVEVARAAAGRVAHVHLKDVSSALAEQVRTGRLGYHDAVKLGMYRPLGGGDVDVGKVVDVLVGAGYRGWYVLEQDAVLASRPDDGSGPMRDVAAGVAFLERIASREEDVPSAVGAAGMEMSRGRMSRDGKEGAT
jgi:inosose dehydratase